MPEIDFQKLSSYKEGILLEVYRRGFLFKNYEREVVQKTCAWLEKYGYIVSLKPKTNRRRFYSGDKGDPYLILLTDKSALYIEKYFYDILKSNSLYNLSAILMPGDKVKFIKHNNQYGINKGMIFNIVDYVSYGTVYISCVWGLGSLKCKCKLYDIRNEAVLLRDSMGTPEEEFQKRIPLIPKEYLTKYMLDDFENNLDVAEIMGHLNSINSFKNRVVSMKDLGIDKCLDSDMLKKGQSFLL